MYHYMCAEMPPRSIFFLTQPPDSRASDTCCNALLSNNAPYAPETIHDFTPEKKTVNGKERRLNNRRIPLALPGIRTSLAQLVTHSLALQHLHAKCSRKHASRWYFVDPVRILFKNLRTPLPLPVFRTHTVRK